MKLRSAGTEARAFVIEMARLASTLDGRPLPAVDAASVLAMLPSPTDIVLVAVDDDARPVGAAWCHVHDPPLVLNSDGDALPELAMAVALGRRREGVGIALVEALAQAATGRYEALTLNVHLRNPALRL